MKTLMVLATVSLVTNAFAARFDFKNNNPNNFNTITKGKMVYELKGLPLVATLKDDRFGWSETFWPSNLGGIAYRWNSKNPVPFKFRMLDKKELLSLSAADLAQYLDEASPAELYDLSQGDYKYSLTKKVLRTYHPEDLWWEGICHGWALAASNYPEPDQTVVRNKDGLQIPFGASDVKGLLAMHDAFNSKGEYARVGARCGVVGKVPGEAFEQDGDVSMPSAKDAARPECSDVNAGTFHLVLTNMIGIHSKGFVADVDRFNDVWNQPVTGYKSEVMEQLPVTPQEFNSGIDHRVRVVTEMSYGDELEFFSAEEAAKGTLGFVSKFPVTGTPAQVTSVRRYEYLLEIDSFGKIIGGEWISDSRPDMMWMKIKDDKFRDGRFPLSGLNTIYKPVKL